MTHPPLRSRLFNLYSIAICSLVFVPIALVLVLYKWMLILITSLANLTVTLLIGRRLSRYRLQQWTSRFVAYLSSSTDSDS